MDPKQKSKPVSQDTIEDARSAALNASLNIYRRLSLHRGSWNFQNYPSSSATIKSSSIVIGEYKEIHNVHHENDLDDHEARWDTESISFCEPSVLSALTIDTTEPIHHSTSASTSRYESIHQSDRKKIYRAIKNIPLVNMIKLKKACRDIWMCCYCGVTFLSEDFASAHEVMCVKNAFCNIFGSYNSTNSTNATYITRFQNHIPQDGRIELPFEVKVKMIMTDEALHKIAKIGKRFILTAHERESLKALQFKFRDRLYYDIMADLTCSKQIASNKDMSILVKKQGIMSKLQSRLADAYELIKEGNTTEHGIADHYERKVYRSDTRHDNSTLYVNIIVKQSIKFVTNELERIATERWRLIERSENKEFKNQFERIRKMAHTRALQIAKLALQADAKPEKVAIQLSNDLFRLFPVQLKQIGVNVEADIEFRKGSFFILSVNILSINWPILMRHCYQGLHSRKTVQKSGVEAAKLRQGRVNLSRSFTSMDTSSAKTFCQCFIQKLFTFELLEHLLSMLYVLHWTISLTFCTIFYYFAKNLVNRFILIAATDDVFQYIERKGMEMDLIVKPAKLQSTFFYDALQVIRREEVDRSKKQAEADKGKEDIQIRGPLLGPKMKLDEIDVGPIPDNMIPPENLETVCFELDLPIGFHRLRWALLHDAQFVEAWFIDFLKYDEFTYEPWDKYDGKIGSGQQDDETEVNESDFIGAKIKYSYLMPKSAFVAANTAYEEVELTSYNKYFFSTLRSIRNPYVPYGNTFISQVQTVVYNTGKQSCRLVISCESFFPDREPMVSRTIKSAMRAGTTDSSVLLGEIICRYAEIHA